MKYPKFLLILLLSSAAFYGCIPTGVPPANTFNVNIQSEREQFIEFDTSIMIDGDSIRFYINNFNFFEIIDYLYISSKSNQFEYLNVKTYFHNTNTYQFDSTTLLTDVNAVNSGVFIDNSYSAHSWVPFIFTNNQYICASILYRTTDASPDLKNGLFKNTDQYIVFRKLKGAQYQYYWLKVRNNEQPGGSNTIQILNGKYQLNSITTGL